MTVPLEEAPANYVPAAAVTRRGRALSGITGRKECVGGARGLRLWPNHSPPCELESLSTGGESGIPSVAVKCVDIRRNTSGEGGFLD